MIRLSTLFGSMRSGLACLGVLLVTVQTFAASLEDLVKDRLAIEKVYFSKQVGNRGNFDEVVSRVDIEKRVEAEARKEQLLQGVYGVAVTQELIEGEMRRIESTSLDKPMLRQLQAALRGERDRFARTVVKPLLVDRALRARFQADEAPQKREREKAEQLRAELLAQDAASRLVQARSKEGLELKWYFDQKALEQVANAAAASTQMTGAFKNLPEEMQKVVEAQLRQAGDVSAVFASEASFTIYVAISRTAEALTVRALEFPKVSFEQWLAAQLNRAS